MGAGSAASTEEDDFRAIASSPTSAVCGGLIVGAGLFTALLGFQTTSMLRMEGMMVVVATAFFVFGVPNIVLGWNVRKVRGWAAQTAVAVAGAATLASLGWAVYLILNGVFSPLAFLVAPINVVAVIVALIRVGPGKRADAARRRLEEQGLSAGM